MMRLGFESSFISTYKGVFDILDGPYKRRFFYILILILLTSVADLLGLAIFIPVLVAVTNENFVEPGTRWFEIKAMSGIESEKHFLLALFGGALGFFIFRAGFILLSQWFQSKFVYKLTEHIGKTTYRYYLSREFQVFKNYEASKIVRELTVSPQQFARLLVLPLLLLTTELLVMSFIIVAIALYNFTVFAMVAVTILPISYLFNRLLKKRMKAYGEIQNKLTPQFIASSMRGIGGFVDVILRGKQQNLLSHYSSLFDRQNQIYVRTSVINIAPSKIFELSTVAGMLLIITYAVIWSDQHELLLPLIALYAAAGYRMIPSLSRISPALLTLEQHSYLLDLYREPMKEAQRSDDELEDNELEFRSEILLEDINFSFADDNASVLENLDMRIAKGEILGLIGKSGSGKTTLANLIVGLLSPSSGRILIDSKELSKQNKRAWMGKISYVQQSPYIERGSLARNVAFLEDQIDDERLNKAIVGASLTDLIGSTSPHNFSIEESGKNLSGGQKQRIIIARALYNEAQVIILDEATAALDNQTEAEVNQTVNSLRGTGVTIIIIAHRYSTLKYTDRIIELEKGKVLREVTYDQI